MRELDIGGMNWCKLGWGDIKPDKVGTEMLLRGRQGGNDDGD